jgi:hypothetical protein
MVFVLGKAADKFRGIDIAILGMGMSLFFLPIAHQSIYSDIAIVSVIVFLPLSFTAGQLPHLSIAFLGVGMGRVLRQSAYKLPTVIAIVVMAMEHIVGLRLTDQSLHHRGHGQAFLGVGMLFKAAVGFLGQSHGRENQGVGGAKHHHGH